LANLVQVSMVVSAKAETVNATKPIAKPSGIPSEVIIAPRPSANSETGPWLSSFVRYSDRLITITAPNAMMAKKVSINMPPKPTSLTSSSLSICLDVVPEATREWNPLIAPQAIVTNNTGKIKPKFSGATVTDVSISITGLATKIPQTAKMISP